MKNLTALFARIAAFFSRRSGPDAELLASIQSSEAAAVEREKSRAQRKRLLCLYDQSGISVAERDYMHSVEQSDESVSQEIEALDELISAGATITFTLCYPFEKPFNGVVQGEVTLRRLIDAIRGGFDTMYEGTTQRDIPGMDNKEVSGPYGTSFHVMSDLFIESIELCEGDVLEISIGS